MKIDLVFLIILGIVILYVFIFFKIDEVNKINKINKIDKFEFMTNVNDQIAVAVKNYYLSDEFIRHISTVSAQLQQNGLRINGNLYIRNRNVLAELDRLNARFPGPNNTLDLSGGRIIYGGDYFHFTGPGGKGARQLASSNFYRWGGW